MTPKDKRDIILFIVLTIIIVLACCSCKSVQYVPVETVMTDTMYVSKEKTDSIYVLDSVFVREKGDTLLIEKTKLKYIERILHDTIYKSKTDSIAVPYPVEQPLTWWQGTKIKFFPWLVVMCVGLLGWVCRKPIGKLISLMTKL